MKQDIYVKALESNVVDCYNYFISNTKTMKELITEDRDNKFNNMVFKLQQSMNILIVTNLVNLIDRVIEDGREKEGVKRQYNVSSIQTTATDRIYLICHEVVGYDESDQKYVLDSTKSFVEFKDITKVY